VGLSAIQAAGIQEQRRREPIAGEIHHRRGHQRANPPVPAQYPLHSLEVRLGRNRNLEDEIEDGVAYAIWLGDLEQRGGETVPCLQMRHDRVGQGQAHLWLGPPFGPGALRIGEAKGQITAAPLQIDAESIRLTCVSATVSRVGQDAHPEHGHRLHLFIESGETAIFKERPFIPALERAGFSGPFSVTNPLS
jgi:hypothetical protein